MVMSSARTKGAAMKRRNAVSSISDVSKSTATWGEQNRLGRDVAKRALTEVRNRENPGLLLKIYEQEIAGKCSRGVMVGFFHEIAEAQLR